MNFFRHGFRRHEKAAEIERKSTHQLEMIDDPANAPNTDYLPQNYRKSSYVHELEFEEHKKAANKPQKGAQQVAFETNSSIGSENVSLSDSMQVSESVLASQSKQGAEPGSSRASFWRYFFKMKRTNPHPSMMHAEEFAYTDDMHTI